MIVPNCIHYVTGGHFSGNTMLADIGKKPVLQRAFIGSVGLEVHRKRVVMGGSESICSVVDQLTHSVEVKKIHLLFCLQTLCDALHIILAGEPVMTPQGVTTNGAFQICGRISVRLGTAE